MSLASGSEGPWFEPCYVGTGCPKINNSFEGKIIMVKQLKTTTSNLDSSGQYCVKLANNVITATNKSLAPILVKKL